MAKTSEKVVVVIGLTDTYESEGYDRSHMDLPMGHNKLVEEIINVNPNAVILFVGGSPVTFPWLRKVPALLNLYLGGEANGDATLDLIFGDVNPSGKLAETFPKHLQDNISSAYFPMGPKTVEYRESIFVGYRYFDSAKKAVRFPFGYGLSYTKFEYSNLKLSSQNILDTDGLTVSFDVKNIGDVEGAEVAQVYVSDKHSKIFRPEKELKGFDKVYLKSGESKKVTIKLDSRAFSYWNTDISDWFVESGEFNILVGGSSQDLPLSAKVNVTTSKPEVTVPDYHTSCPAYYNIGELDAIEEEQFEVLYGSKLPNNTPYKRGEYTINSTLTDVSGTRLGRFLLKTIGFGAKIVVKGAQNKAMVQYSIASMPIRSFSGFTGGIISMMSAQGLVDMMNKTKGGGKKFIKGFKKENK